MKKYLGRYIAVPIVVALTHPSVNPLANLFPVDIFIYLLWKLLYIGN